jgi:periplasmic protein TonB
MTGTRQPAGTADNTDPSQTMPEPALQAPDTAPITPLQRGWGFASAVAVALAVHGAAIAVLLTSQHSPYGFGGSTTEAVHITLVDGTALAQRFTAAAAGRAMTTEAAADQAGNADVTRAPSPAAATSVSMAAADRLAQPMPPHEIATEVAIQPVTGPTPDIVPERNQELERVASTAAPTPQSAAAAAIAGGLSTQGRETVVAAKPAAAGAPPGVAKAYAESVVVALRKAQPTNRGTSGLVRVVFTISTAGDIDKVAVDRSSGKDALDDQALAALRRARFKTPPDALTAAQRTFGMTYQFR